MIWIKFSGDNIMEFCFRNIKPKNDNYDFVNQNFLNRLKLKKIRNKNVRNSRTRAPRPKRME